MREEEQHICSIDIGNDYLAVAVVKIEQQQRQGKLVFWSIVPLANDHGGARRPLAQDAATKGLARVCNKLFMDFEPIVLCVVESQMEQATRNCHIETYIRGFCNGRRCNVVSLPSMQKFDCIDDKWKQRIEEQEAVKSSSRKRKKATTTTTSDDDGKKNKNPRRTNMKQPSLNAIQALLQMPTTACHKDLVIDDATRAAYARLTANGNKCDDLADALLQAVWAVGTVLRVTGNNNDK